MGLFLAAVGLAAGFILPGAGLASGLHIRARGTAAFIMSSVLLFETVFLLGVMGVPLTFRTLFPCLCVLSLLAFLFGRRNDRRPVSAARPTRVRPASLFLSIPVALAGGLFFLRSVLQPLNGYDTSWRWSLLAEEIFRTGTFNFYPPLRQADFLHYFFVDAIPPMCQFSYFWLYTCVGTICPTWTALLTCVQLVLIAGMCFRLADRLGGRLAAFYSLATLSTAVIFFWSVLMAQETGLTALSVCATLYFIVSSTEEHRSEAMIAAGFATALGILSREYGWAIMVCGLSAAMATKVRRDMIVLYAGLSLVLAAPWYLRTWILTGNPFYSNPVGALFAVNPVIEGLLRHFASVLSLTIDPLQKLDFLQFLMVSKSLLVIPAGLAGLYILRKSYWLHLSILVCALIWVKSVAHTAGGLYYSTRVLSPAFVLLAVAAGCLLARLHQRGPLIRAALGLGITLIAATALLQETIVPGHLETIESAEALLGGFQSTETDPVFVPMFNDVPPQSRCLSAWAGAWVAFKNTDIEIVPVWSPDASVIFDPGRPVVEVARMLENRNIKWILMSRTTILDYLEAASPLYKRCLMTRPYALTPGGGFALFSLPECIPEPIARIDQRSPPSTETSDIEQ